MKNLNNGKITVNNLEEFKQMLSGRRELSYTPEPIKYPATFTWKDGIQLVRIYNTEFEMWLDSKNYISNQESDAIVLEIEKAEMHIAKLQNKYPTNNIYRKLKTV